MSIVKVYRDSMLLETVAFHKQFMIFELGEDLHWHADEELAQAAKGTIQVWVRLNKISYVLPGWTLSIDNIICESQLYEDVEIGNRLIKLSYRDYQFMLYEQVDADRLPL